jgi:hypothetical protein
VTVDDPAFLHPYPVFLPGFGRHGKAVDQFMDCEDDRFKIG